MMTSTSFLSDRRLVYIMLVLTVVTCTLASPLNGLQAPVDGLCRTTGALRTCRLCGDIFGGEFQSSECCSDQILNSLCQSFVNSVRANDKRYFGTKKGFHLGNDFGKRSRNTFLGKRFAVDDFDSALEERGMDGSESYVDGEMMVDKRLSRNNFLGKRVVRSADRRISTGSSRISRLIEIFVDQLATEVLLMQSRPRGLSNSTSSTDELRQESTFLPKLQEERLDRDQRARNTFLGKRA